jgi:hypothetical protein
MEHAFRHTGLTYDAAVEILAGLGTTETHAQKVIEKAEHSTFGDTTETINGVTVRVDVAMTRSNPYSVRTPDQR